MNFPFMIYLQGQFHDFVLVGQNLARGLGTAYRDLGEWSPPRSWQVFIIIEAFLAATLKRFKDVMNFIRTMIFLKYKIKVVYHIQMGQDNNLVERHSLSSEFHMLKWNNIYGFRNINLSLDCLIFSGKRGGHTSTLPPSGPATDQCIYPNAYLTRLKRKWHFRFYLTK